jgi:hypothetical protein
MTWTMPLALFTHIREGIRHNLAKEQDHKSACEQQRLGINLRRLYRGALGPIDRWIDGWDLNVFLSASSDKPQKALCSKSFGPTAPGRISCSFVSAATKIY